MQRSNVEGLAGWMIFGAGVALAALWGLNAYLGGLVAP